MVLNRKDSLFVGNGRGGETVHGVNPQNYLMQALVNVPRGEEGVVGSSVTVVQETRAGTPILSVRVEWEVVQKARAGTPILSVRVEWGVLQKARAGTPIPKPGIGGTLRWVV